MERGGRGLKKENSYYSPLTTVNDDGYSEICWWCSKRSGQKEALIGLVRTVEIITCCICQIKIKKAKKKDYNIISGGTRN